MGILIDEAKCIGCGLCEIACAYEAIDVRIKARADNGKCTDCAVCLDYCPTDAIALETPPPAGPALPPGQASFDVAVVGSGVGGLCAGALLARRGHRTVVLERFPTVGGRYSSLRHKNVFIPTGGSLIGKGGPLEEVFKEVGADFDVVSPEENPRYWLRGRWVDPGPGSGQLRRALTMVSQAETADVVMASMKVILTARQFPPGTMLQWLASLTDNEEVKGVFKAITAAAFGPEDVPAGDFFGLLAATAGRGMGLARRGGLNLMRNLARTITGNGGEVWKLSRVKAIVQENGRAAALQVDRQGQPWTVKARVIVTDIGPKQTVRLLGPQNLDPQYISYVDQNVRPMGGITVHLISDKSLLDGFSGVVYAVGARRICILFEASRIAEWAGPGVHFIELYPKAGPDPSEPVDWEQHIEEAEADIDDIFPAWRRHAEMKVICLQGEYPGNQTWTGMGVAAETPVPNLFMVGDGCQSSLGNAGGTAAAESAQRAAALVQERFPLT